MRLAVITPVYAAVPGPAYEAIAALAYEVGKSGGRLWHRTIWGCSNLPFARFSLAKWAVATDADRVLFVDDDIVYTTQDIEALYAIDADVVSGMYSRRELRGAIVGAPLTGGEERGLLLEMAAVGLGCCLMRRSVLAALVEKYGERLFAFTADQKGPGEDDSFSHRMIVSGYRAWLHRGVSLGHVGSLIFGGQL